jgi:hypothetical protein
MSTGSAPSPGAADAHALVAAFKDVAAFRDGAAFTRSGGAVFARSRGGAWRLDRAAVATRLDELVANPDLVRQGRMNLCGPAAVVMTWLHRDPVAAVRYAITLFETGRAHLGSFEVVASRGLRNHPYGGRSGSCPPADWLMLSALRDATNRVLPYASDSRWREPPAGITTSLAMRRWLRAVGTYESIEDSTSPVLPKRVAHAASLVPGPDRDVFLLVAQEMFRQPTSRVRRVHDRVVSLVPNHWVVLRSPVRVEDDVVRLSFWTWGATYAGAIERRVFNRCYFGAIKALAAPAGPA